MPKIKTFTVNNKDYEIRFNIARIEMYENSHRPILATFSQNGGMFSLSELIGLVGVGLKEVGGNFVNPKQGQDMARELIEKEGYMPMMEEMAVALERDAGFFFKGASIG